MVLHDNTFKYKFNLIIQNDQTYIIVNLVLLIQVNI